MIEDKFFADHDLAECKSVSIAQKFGKICYIEFHVYSASLALEIFNKLLIVYVFFNIMKYNVYTSTNILILLLFSLLQGL